MSFISKLNSFSFNFQKRYFSKTLEFTFEQIANSKSRYWSRRKMRHLGPLVWIDCEMTGLDVKNDHIIEICCLITDGQLNLLDETGFEAVIHYPKETMDNMGKWCKEMHGKVINSSNSLDQINVDLLNYVKKYVPNAHSGLLSGNSVHQDRLFLLKEFPNLVDYLHYRLIDVSTIKEIGFRHNPSLMNTMPPKKMAHTAKSDIMESINELKWYYEHYLIKPDKSNLAK